ncbi:MAG: hypothetical protein IKA70_02415 [Alistipes sp.]|nr:hypothetical protein [Alistipes sp.]
MRSNSIRYITLLVVAAMATFEAAAWSSKGHQVVAGLADKYLLPNVQREVHDLLGSAMENSAELPHTIYYLNLTTEGQPQLVEGDVLIEIERHIGTLRNRNNLAESEAREALKALIHLVADMHCVGHVRFADKACASDYTIYLPNGATGKAARRFKMTWREYWSTEHLKAHYGYSTAMHIRDLELRFKGEAYDMAHGLTPRDWAVDMGCECRPLYAWAKDEMDIPRLQHLALEELTNRTLAKAGWRLAAMLNNIFK